MLVQDFLHNSFENYAKKIALICDNKRLTYGEIETLTNKLAHALVELGIQRNDRIVIFLPNSVETVISIFAILKASGIFVIVNPTTKRDKLTYILNNCRASALITLRENASLAGEVQSHVPTLKFILCSSDGTESDEEIDTFYDFDAIIEDSNTTRPKSKTIDQDLACLIYTSGSTGEPKGVMSGHNNMVFASTSITSYLENVPEDIVINVLPLSFDYGLYQLIMVFQFGGTLVLERSFNYPAYILDKIAKEKVTGLPGVPTMFSIMVQMDLNKFDLSSIRYITNTAAALPPKHILEFRKKFPWAKLFSMYGLTECKRTLYLPPHLLDKKPGSVGIAIPGTEVWIEDDNGAKLGPGKIGELIIRGSHVMRGYWGDVKATAEMYREGPTPGERTLCSGDLFKMDEDGLMYFVSRKDDIIKCRGEKVSPKEVENVLYNIKGVVEAAVIGVDDEMLGQAIKAFVVTRDKTMTSEDVKKYCSMHLENFMVPQYVEFKNSLTKTSSGKITKKDLS
jgi:amino acid adenylation domain-containing protein